MASLTSFCTHHKSWSAKEQGRTHTVSSVGVALHNLFQVSTDLNHQSGYNSATSPSVFVFTYIKFGVSVQPHLALCLALHLRLHLSY